MISGKETWPTPQTILSPFKPLSNNPVIQSPTNTKITQPTHPAARLLQFYTISQIPDFPIQKNNTGKQAHHTQTIRLRITGKKPNTPRNSYVNNLYKHNNDSFFTGKKGVPACFIPAFLFDGPGCFSTSGCIIAGGEIFFGAFGAPVYL